MLSASIILLHLVIGTAHGFTANCKIRLDKTGINNISFVFQLCVSVISKEVFIHARVIMLKNV